MSTAHGQQGEPGMSMHHLAGVLVLAGGTAARMGGVSKPDVMVAGKRLLDHALAEISRTAPRARIVVVAPPDVSVPPSVIRILEDPPLGGPLAGYAAGFHALTIDEGALVAFMTCDAPLSARLFPALLEAFEAESCDGAVPVQHTPEGDILQLTQGIYRSEFLQDVMRDHVRNKSLRRAFSDAHLVGVPDQSQCGFDVDTWEEVATLEEYLLSDDGREARSDL